LFVNGINSYLSVSWTLQYEFAFYLTFPAILIAVRLFGAKLATAGVLAVSILTLPDLFIRGTALFAGAAIAAWPDDQLRAFARKVPLAAVVAAFEVPLIARSSGFALTDFHMFYALFLPAAALLLVKVAFDQNPLSAILSSVPMRKLGTISYSFYLFHLVVISSVMNDFVAPLGIQHTVAGAAIFASVSLVLALIAGWVSYLLFERMYFSAALRGIPRMESGMPSSSLQPAP
jgi:peptidoglycan/LPS O-acetylase OafA/YrhL